MNRADSEPILQALDVSYRYECATLPVLDLVNLTIRQGEFVALVGENGAGKTTLAKVFCGLLQPTSGELLVAGQSLRTPELSLHAGLVGYVYQNPDHQIFARSVRDEIAYGPRNLRWPAARVDEAVEHALDLVELRHEADSYPFILGRGQRQKLAIASTIAMGSPVMVVDEPTTGLDLSGVRSIMELLRKRNAKGHTIVIVTHDMDIVAEYAARTIVMTRGKIVADGETRRVLTNEPLLREANLAVPGITKIAQLIDPRHMFPRDVLTLAEFRAAMVERIETYRRGVICLSDTACI